MPAVARRTGIPPDAALRSGDGPQPRQRAFVLPVPHAERRPLAGARSERRPACCARKKASHPVEHHPIPRAGSGTRLKLDQGSRRAARAEDLHRAEEGRVSRFVEPDCGDIRLLARAADRRRSEMSRTAPAMQRGPAVDLTRRRPACRLRPRRSRRSQQSRHRRPPGSLLPSAQAWRRKPLRPRVSRMCE